MPTGPGSYGTTRGRPPKKKARARKAGMSTSAFADKSLRTGSKPGTKTKRQASLAKILAGMRRRRRA